MYFAFRILLILILILGHIIGYNYFYKETNYRISRYFNSLICAYPTILFVTLFTGILSSRYYYPEILFIILINFIYILTSILTALGANIYVQKIEEKLHIKKNRRNYFLRILVVLIGAISIVTSISVTKSMFYQLGITDYSFSGKEIERIILRNTLEKENKIKEEKIALDFFLKDVGKIDEDTLRLKRKNIFSFISGKYKVITDKTYNFKLEYDYFRGSKETVDVHNVKYSSKGGKESFVMISTIKSRLSYLKKDELLRAILSQQEEFTKKQIRANEKKANMYDFAFSSFIDFLGFEDYEYEAKGNLTKIIDKILQFSFWIVSSILFFEFTRRYKK